MGAITVSRSGHFSISGSKNTYHSSKYGFSFITTSHVTGEFKTSKTASGSITFTQKYVPKTGTGSTCHSTPRLFAVKLK